MTHTTWKQRFEKQLPRLKRELSEGRFGVIADLYGVFGETYGHPDLLRHRKRVAALLANALEGLDGGQVIRCLGRFRSSTRMEWFMDWRNKLPERFLTSDMTPAERYWVLALGTTHPCGYLRERSFTALSREDGGRGIGIALLGLCDHVGQVREAAEGLLTTKLQTATPAELCRAIPYAVAFLRSERAEGFTGDSSSAFSAYTDALKEADCRAMLTAVLASGDTHTRRFCADRLAETEDGVAILLERLPREPDPMIRRYLFERSMECFPFLAAYADGIPAPVAGMLRDPLPKNRSEGLSWLRRHAPDRALAPAMAALTDPNAAVRMLAQDTVAVLDPAFSVVNFYRTAVSAAGADDRSLPATLYGLGETGCATDRSLILPHGQASRPAVVSAALYALASLTPAEEMGSLTAPLTEALLDPRAGVVKTASLLLYKLGCPDAARVTEIMTEADAELTRIRCLFVLSRAGKWRRLIGILTALELGGDFLTRKATAMLNRWLLTYNHSFAQPTAAEAFEVGRLVKACSEREKVTPEQSRQLTFILAAQ